MSAASKREERRASDAAPAPRVHPRAQNAPELKVAGRNACRALYDTRPHDIRRVYVTEDNIPFFADALKFCARERIAYHIKTSADLDAVAETVHHDGVLFLARAKPQVELPAVIDGARAMAAARTADTLVLLEDVKNPHNVGAILRVCAHFGVRAVLAAGQTPALSPAVMRTAEGGAEHVQLVPAGDSLQALAALRGLGYVVIATSSHTDQAVGAVQLPPRAVVLFGSEAEGLSPALLAAAQLKVAIPGSGALESLNVACASSVVLWELWRQHRPGPASAERALDAKPSGSSARQRRRSPPGARSGAHSGPPSGAPSGASSAAPFRAERPTRRR